MKKKLAIIGASYLQLPLVERAKKTGIETHCFAWSEGAICKEIADFFYPISILEKDDILQKCIDIKIDGNTAKVTREIDGGKETVSASLPLVIGGQKGLVEEKDLRIPNMRGIMTARTKPLTNIEPTTATIDSKAVKFEKPAPKSAVKLISSDNLDELINLLHNEAKVI